MTVPVVALEIHTPNGWVQVGTNSINEPRGSLASNDPDGRRVYVFGFDGQRPGVWISDSGIDLATNAARQILSVHLRQLSDLTEPYELTIHSLAGQRRIRFTTNIESPTATEENHRRTAPGR